MLREVCIKDKCTMKVDRIGVFALEFQDTALTRPYKLWMADAVRCPKCNTVVLTRWGNNPIAEEWEKDFYEKLNEYKNQGRMIIEFY